MPVHLNHTIVYARDKELSARFLADLLGLDVAAQFGPFLPVTTDNEVTLDFADAEAVNPQHYAFLVEEDEFDKIFGRVQAAGITYYADPHRTKPGEINHLYGGRGVYFCDPDGHVMEVITQPYS